MFRIPTFRRWVVFAAGAELIEDVRKAPEDILSMRKPNDEVCMYGENRLDVHLTKLC